MKVLQKIDGVSLRRRDKNYFRGSFISIMLVVKVGLHDSIRIQSELFNLSGFWHLKHLKIIHKLNPLYKVSLNNNSKAI